MDLGCGLICLSIIAKYYGKSYSLQTLRARSFIIRERVSIFGISDVAVHNLIVSDYPDLSPYPINSVSPPSSLSSSPVSAYPSALAGEITVQKQLSTAFTSFTLT